MRADAVTAALARGFGGMNMIFDQFGLPEDDSETTSRGLAEVLERAGIGGHCDDAVAPEQPW